MLPFNSYRAPRCVAQLGAEERSLTMMPGAPRTDAIVIAISDFRRDWRRSNAAERSCAAAFGLLWAADVATPILGQGAFQHTFPWVHAIQ